MRRFARWFTPERRQQIQVFLVALAPLAIMFGFGTEGVWEQILIITGAVLTAIAGLLNLLNVRLADWATQGWMIVRGVIYAFATAVSPALVLLGFYSEEVNTQILVGLSLGISALNAAVAIFANGQQQRVEVIQQVARLEQASLATQQNRDSGFTGDGIFK